MILNFSPQEVLRKKIEVISSEDFFEKYLLNPSLRRRKR